MKLAALVSGGKDSCYALGLAQDAGHDVVVLLNLCPADEREEDTDSHCFQTIGHATAPALAAATGLPLLRRRLTGRSTSTGMGYSAAVAGDEVEDLTALLVAAAARFRGLQGVISGAVGSDYQRLRVEHAAGRAGLVALAPLWHVPQLQLLADMAAAGLTAVLVKVAAEGLPPGQWLGRSLADATPRLTALAARLGLNPAGEGGEYETLALDCPAFGCGRLEVVGGQATPVGGGAGVMAGLRVRVVAKDESGPEAPPGEVVWLSDDPPPAAKGEPVPEASPDAALVAAAGVRVSAAAGTAQAWATARVVAGDGADPTSPSPAAAVRAALDAVDAGLQVAGIPAGLASASHVRLYLPSMAGFEPANSAYVSAIPGPDPPARACLAPGGVALPVVTVDVVAPLNPTSRRVLHVQTISPWAPACIGPYAQAVADGSGYEEGEEGASLPAPFSLPPCPLLRLAGQIGLDPASMALVDAASQPARCLASAGAVGVAMGADLRGLGVGWTLLGAGGVDSLPALGAAFEEWWGGEEDGAGDAAASSSSSSSSSSSAASDGYLGRGAGGGVGESPAAFTDSYLLAASLPPSSSRPPRPVTLFLHAAGLPRGAVAEVEALAAAPGWRAGMPAVPRWVGRLERWECGGAAGLIAPGAFAHVVAGGRGDLEAAAAAAATGVAACMAAAGLGPGDVGVARVYARTDAAPGGKWASKVDAALAAAWAGAGLGGSGCPPPVCVPVLAVGLTAAAVESLVVEVTAAK